MAVLRPHYSEPLAFSVLPASRLRPLDIGGEHRVRVMGILQDLVSRRVAAIENLEPGRGLGDAAKFCAA